MNAVTHLAEASGRRRRGRTVEGSRDRIVSATLEMILDRGASAITLGDIVKAAKTSRATLYRHFSGREAILESVFDRAIAITYADLGEKIAARPHADERLDVVCGWLGSLLKSQIFSRLMETDVEFMLELLRRVNSGSWPVFDAALEPVYERARATFGIEPDRELVNEIISRLHVSLGLFPSSRTSVEPERVLKAVFQALLLGRTL